MLTFVFTVVMIWIVCKLLALGLKAAWGITKLLCAVILLPALVIWLVCVGFIYLAVPVLVIAGVVVLVRDIAEV